MPDFVTTRGRGRHQQLAPSEPSRGSTQFTSVSRFPVPSHLTAHGPRSAFTTTPSHCVAQPQTTSYTSASFEIGDIIRFPHLVPSLNPNEKDPDSRVPTANAGPICPKIRFGIVIAVYLTRIVVLPMYSCGRKGVTNRSTDYVLTSISVWNLADQGQMHRALLTKEYFDTQGSKKWVPGSHVNLTDVVSIGFDWNIVTGFGKLSEKARALLLKRYEQVQKSQYQSNPRTWYEQKVIDDLARERASAARSRVPTVPASMVTGAQGSTAPSWATLAKGPAVS